MTNIQDKSCFFKLFCLSPTKLWKSNSNVIIRSGNQFLFIIQTSHWKSKWKFSRQKAFFQVIHTTFLIGINQCNQNLVLQYFFFKIQYQIFLFLDAQVSLAPMYFQLLNSIAAECVCVFQKCVFQKCIFWKCIFQKCIFQKYIYPKCILRNVLDLRVFQALRLYFTLVLDF